MSLEPSTLLTAVSIATRAAYTPSPLSLGLTFTFAGATIVIFLIAYILIIFDWRRRLPHLIDQENIQLDTFTLRAELHLQPSASDVQIPEQAHLSTHW